MKVEQTFKELPERINTQVYPDADNASIAIAARIAQVISEKAENGQDCVLGLATGSSPKGVYRELIRLHNEEGLSFRNVITFNLDEYYPIVPTSIQSYWRFMHEQIFDHVDIPPENIHIPDGRLDINEIRGYCQDYEKKIKEAGDLDLQILGIGRTGHIGFNEPGSGANSLTRLITLDKLTRADAAGDFFGLENVPRKAITMGVGTILQANEIILMAWGEGKAPIIKKTLEGTVTDQVPATYLQSHPNCKFYLDEIAASELTRIKTPWLVESCEWDQNLSRKAVVWLCQKTNKPILKLTDRDYNDHGMGDLVSKHGSAYELNIHLFNQLQHTITGWPGGKPDAEDTQRPERAKPAKKRVLIFSPHPDDDVISMGGTFLRLVDQGHDVHVAYQTSGNIAVADHEALRFAEFARDYHKYLSNGTNNEALYNSIIKEFNYDKSDITPLTIRKIKGLIRRGEALGACRFFGIPDGNVHYLDLPFYETGKVQKHPLGEEDVKIVSDLIEELKPHQIYAAGDLADPHGTHEVCLRAIFQALNQLKAKSFMSDCWVWLYRGAWLEYSIDEVEMAVPLSPDELMKKRLAIWRHQSQKDGVVFQGEDSREFWQRAEERNRETAKSYNQLGFAEYEAMEAFHRYHF